MKHATIEDAPAVLSTNDKAMWVLGFNEGQDATIKRLAAGVSVEPYCMHWEDRWGCNHYADPKEYIGANAQPLYTATAIAAARAQENERCAQALEALWHSNDDSTKKCIAAIRALLGKEQS